MCRFAPKAAGRGDFRFGCWALLVTLLCVYALLFQHLSGLRESSEGRYVNVAVQMLQNDDWLHPRTHHEHLHWTKPPLTYWAIALSVKTFGRNETAARLPGSMAFVLTVVFVFLLGRLFVPGRPWFPALIYLSCLAPGLAWPGHQYHHHGQPADPGRRHDDDRLRLRLFLRTGQFRGSPRRLAGLVRSRVGYLIKGPAIALPLLALLVFHLGNRREFPHLRAHLFPGVVLAALIGGSWYISLLGDQPLLVFRFLWEVVILRATTGAHHRNAQWYGGFVVYLPVLLVGTLPWLRQVADGVRGPLSAWWRERRLSAPNVTPRDKFLLLWLLLPLAVLMLARSRLPLYALPLFAPLALLAARRADDMNWKRALKLAAIGIVIVLGAKLATGFVTPKLDDRRLADQLRSMIKQPITELVFVQTSAQQGLSFYLHAEVEEILFDGAKGRQGLEQEVLEAEPHRVWLARESMPRSWKNDSPGSRNRSATSAWSRENATTACTWTRSLRPRRSIHKR